jgi:hypothetical protein
METRKTGKGRGGHVSRAKLPPATDHPGLYHRAPKLTFTKFEYYLTDFIKLASWRRLDTFMKMGGEVRDWFEKSTGWELVLSGRCESDDTCQDRHGQQILNLWRIRSNNLDSIPQGLGQLFDISNPNSTAKTEGAIFSQLLDLFRIEHHFITRSYGGLSMPPQVRPQLQLPGYVPAFVYVEFWTEYTPEGSDYSFTADLFGDTNRQPVQPSNLLGFAAPWQFIANLRAISGRVNTFSQYWLRMVPVGVDYATLSKLIREEIRQAGWYQPHYRPMRVDLLIPSTYDRTAELYKRKDI